VRTALVLFTRDLRVQDHPALATAAREAERVVPLFVVDDRIRASGFVTPNRAAFLADALRDLDEALRQRGGRLVVRRGDVVRETLRVAEAAGAEAVHLSADVSAGAAARERDLARACRGAGIALRLHPGVTVVPAGRLTPENGDHYRVFTPYWRAWSATALRPAFRAPARVELPEGIEPGRLPDAAALADGRPSPDLARGGLTEAARRAESWVRDGLDGYSAGHDALAADATSRLSAHLHFGCVSPAQLARRAEGRAGGEAFVRRLCWRDFHHQVLAARPDLPHTDYRRREDERPDGGGWRDDDASFAAWREGRTGHPVVDAAMRQLAREGFMHNRARMIVASFLTRDLGIDWRRGAAHFLGLLADGDLANNSGNWQWVAGTGNDMRPNRVLNPVRQARRFDPSGDYVRRYLPELAGVAGPAVHEPWRLDAATRRGLDYPDPIVHHAEAARASRARPRRTPGPEQPSLFDG
jgi:deoxyribodipyrimidine photo-lyase